MFLSTRSQYLLFRRLHFPLIIANCKGIASVYNYFIYHHFFRICQFESCGARFLAPRPRIAPLSFAPTRTGPKNSKFYGPEPGPTRSYFPRTGPLLWDFGPKLCSRSSCSRNSCSRSSCSMSMNIIWSNILSQICSRSIFQCTMLQEHKGSMLQEHI